MKQGGKSYLLVALLIFGALLLLAAAASGGQDGDETDDRLPSRDQKQQLEMELEELIGKIEGVSAVQVRVSLESGSEYVYENGKNTLVLAGRVRGVAVVCRGGGDAVVREKIIHTLCALLDLPMKAVSVTQ